MTTTKQLVTLLNDDYMPRVQREKVREYLSRAYLRLMATDNAQAIYYNSADAVTPYPKLKVEDGKLSYLIDSTTLLDSDDAPLTPQITVGGITLDLRIRRVKELYCESSVLKVPGRYKRLEQADPYGYPGYWGSWFTRTALYKVPCSLIDGRYGDACVAQFPYDPKYIATDVWCELWFMPPELTADTIPMLLDIDQWQQALIDGAVGYYEDAVNGVSARLEKFEKQHIRSFSSYMNEQMESQINTRMPVREVG